MDNGKPFRESRDADIPIMIRHFYHYAGWAELMPTEMQNWKPVGMNPSQLFTFQCHVFYCSQLIWTISVTYTWKIFTELKKKTFNNASIAIDPFANEIICIHVLTFFRGGRCNCALEFPIDVIDMESMSSTGNGQYRCSKTCNIHEAIRYEKLNRLL